MTVIPVQINNEWIKLPGLTDEEYNSLQRNSPRSLSVCPTCNGERFDGQNAGKISIDEESDVFYHVNGQYRFNGEIHECDCEGQKALYRAYLACGIGEQYMRLDWDHEYHGDEEIKEYVKAYIERWRYMRANGTGMMLWSEAVGVGKSFAASHIAKSLVKKGIRVHFTAFKNIVNKFVKDPNNTIQYQQMLESVPLLVIDEVWKMDNSSSDSKIYLFSSVFEDVVRNRSDANLPIVFTTNNTIDSFAKDFPRIYSLLQAKIYDFEMSGLDYRRTRQAIEKINLLADDEPEIHPIV